MFVLCCSHARVQIYSVVQIRLLFQCVEVFDVFICHITRTLLGGSVYICNEEKKSEQHPKLHIDRESIVKKFLIEILMLGKMCEMRFDSMDDTITG
jgi:hypothetical protein